MSKEDEVEFSIPQNFIKQLYEFSGGADKNKGIIIALCSEKGVPTIYSHHESIIIELGLKKALEDYLEDGIELVEKEDV